MYTYSSCSFAVFQQSWGHSERGKSIRFSALSSQVFSITCTSFLPGGICAGPSPIQFSDISESPLSCSELHSGASNSRRSSLVMRSIWIPGIYILFFFQFLTVSAQAACWKASKKQSRGTTDRSNPQSTSVSYYLTAAYPKLPQKTPNKLSMLDEFLSSSNQLYSQG